MKWNWQLPNWPKFNYSYEEVFQKERQYLFSLGQSFAFLKNVEKEDYNQFRIEILSQEGLKSSQIEGEILDRGSLQSSIKKHFGLQTEKKLIHNKEAGMAEILCNIHETFKEKLTHEMLWEWHSKLFQHQNNIQIRGEYRTHTEPMQIVSNKFGSPKVFFEAPPSKIIFYEMTKFIDWFNSLDPYEPILGKASIAHVYFESIHPFEDGNGRIGRVLVEKLLSQNAGKPLLIAVSKVLENRRKEYYQALERCNCTLEVHHWVDFFAEVVLQAQEESMLLLQFLITKSKMLTKLSGSINPRQEKALLRIFHEGPTGFKGGLSAENYIAITKASRATATRDLNNLVQMGALTKSGELRHTRYKINLDE